MSQKNTLLGSVEDHVKQYMQEHLDNVYAYHNIDHTLHVVNSAREIASGNLLTPEEMEDLMIACWFHDLGYVEGPKDHEQRGARMAKNYLQGVHHPDKRIDLVVRLIMVTKMPQSPQNILEQIMCDADLSSLGDKDYFMIVGKLRREWEATGQNTFTEESWLMLELDFLRNHSYHNAYAKTLFDKRKKKNIRKVKDRLKELNVNSDILDNEEVKKKKKKKKGNGDPAANYSRGVETMFRSTYRMHINLSAIADNKANIMLSINAIIISISLPSLIGLFTNMPFLIIPSILLIATCLVSVIYATLSTRPKITEGKFSREDIREKRANLLFFGNFYNMSLEEYEWGVQEMLNDNDFLYSSMTRDVYFLGVVLAKKYKYLRICYTVFMYGLVTSVAAFAIAFLINALGAG